MILSKDDKNCLQCENTGEAYCHVKLDALVKLKDSTRKLLILLEEIQSKTQSKVQIPDDVQNLTSLIRPIPQINNSPSVTEVIGANAIKRLEFQAKALDTIYIEDEDTDCSIYKRLTRKCHCLNRHEYNDFIIHFNEDIKFFTNTSGEIIKNMRILKRFLYMGGDYTKNALMFLNEGLTKCPHNEKVEIILGCSHADICNVFEEHSIVIVCISWPCKYEWCGDAMTQSLAAALLYKLAQIEEGRRYLKLNSKITTDVKKTLRKKASSLEYDTLDVLNTTMNLLHPPMIQHMNVTYYCKSPAEGFGSKTLNALAQYREYMTLDEIFTHLDMLNKLSDSETGKSELTSLLPYFLSLFKHMLMEYDNSEMNIIVTTILNNIVAKNMIKDKKSDEPKSLVVADTATEPIQMKNVMNQIPSKKNNSKKNNKSKIGLGLAPNKHRQPSKRKVSNWEPPSYLNRSRKFTNQERSSIIVVPIEK